MVLPSYKVTFIFIPNIGVLGLRPPSATLRVALTREPGRGGFQQGVKLCVRTRTSVITCLGVKILTLQTNIDIVPG